MKIPTIRIALCLAALTGAALAEDRTFPADSGVIDVTQAPFGADPTGKRDSTKALQAALDQYPSGNRILFLPKGTYLISDTLKWPAGKGEGGAQKRTILEGESREGTIIKLADRCQGFTQGGGVQPKYKLPTGKAMIWTGNAPAQRFRNAVRNLTIDAGAGNPGAIGLQFNTSNQGGVEDVTFRAGAGSGRIGLDLGFTGEIGPMLVQRVSIEGFDVGVSSWGGVNSITMGNIALTDQREVGIWNSHQVLSIENLTTRGNVPALENAAGDGVVVLLGARCEGTAGGAKAAILNRGLMRVRDLKVGGFDLAIENAAGTKQNAKGPEVAAFLSHSPTPDPFDPKREVEPLNLPVEPVPTVAWGPLEGWASPLGFGGKPNDEEDDTAAIQAAIDSGAHTVYLPNGGWKLSGTLFLRGDVRRLIGCEAKLEGASIIEVADGSAPVVVVERLELLPTHGPGVAIVHKSARTLVLSHLRMRRTGNAYEAKPGAGNLFIEDVAGDNWHFEKGQKVWARQLNPESDTPMLVNNGADLWVLGLKTENDGTAVHAKAGKTELASAFIYANTRREKTNPLLVIDEGAELSATFGESSFRDQPYGILVSETRKGGTREVKKGEAPKRGQGSAMVLFRAY